MDREKLKPFLRALAVVCGLAGVVMLTMVMYPLISYRVTAMNKFPILLDPSNASGGLQANDEVLDYTKASNWFADGDKAKFDESAVMYYTMSIPRLSIQDAVVAIGGEDLAKHLIQYPGTALPGKRGNATIFGHSTLPSFFDPKNYLSIFSTLPKLNEGDEILLYYDGITYRYLVEQLVEVSPNDIAVLEQNISDSFVSLITCTPPGDPRKPRRLIVRARIAPVETNRHELSWR